MIIKRIHTIHALMSMGHTFSFDCSKHKLNHYPDIQMFGIDDTLIPMSNVREVMIEIEGQVQVSSPAAASLSTADDSRPSETVTKPKTKVKK